MVLHSDVRVNFVSVTLTEAQNYMIGGQSDPQWGSQEEWSVVEFVDNHVNPGKEFFIVHPELVRA